MCNTFNYMKSSLLWHYLAKIANVTQAYLTVNFMYSPLHN